MTIGVLAAASGGKRVPARAIDTSNLGTTALTKTNAEFGSFDRSLFAISMWIKVNVNSTAYTLTKKGFVNQEWAFSLNAANRLTFTFNVNTDDWFITTNETITDTNYHHLLVHFDEANGTTTDRILAWLDGTPITTFGSTNYPTGPVTEQTSGNTAVGSDGGQSLDGLIYQWAFFDGSLPAITDVRNTNGTSKDLSGLPGLKSQIDTTESNITNDLLLADWTNTNGVTADATIPG